MGPFFISERQPDTAYLDFLAVGDTGTGGDGQKAVAAAMATEAEQSQPRFVLLLGDNFYEFGISSDQASEWKTRFEDIYFQDSLQIPFYAVLGNHDYFGNSEAQVAYAQSGKSSRWKMPARYYHFSQQLSDQTEVLFVALDSNSLLHPFGGDPQQLAWLEQTLQASSARWKIVYAHHPLYSGGQHGNNPSLIKQLEPLLQKYGVDLYLAGHDHDQQMLQPHGPLHFVVSGAGAKSRDVHWLPNSLYAATNFGFTHFRVSAQEMVISFLNAKSQRSFAYTIQKTAH